MISSNEIRNRQISVAQNGYDKNEVNILLDEAADTVDSYANESKELYHKMEVLAQKIEEYREEEDSIKAALITAEKMADKIKKDSNEKANELISSSESQAKSTIDDANQKAEKIISEAREYSSKLIEDKTAEAAAIIADAEKKANDAINGSKIVAQNILDQAKEISNDLVSKSKEEKEAYELLISALKTDAKAFIENLKSLYSEQLDVLCGAKLETEDSNNEKSTETVDSIQQEVDSLVSEMAEMENAIPESITIDNETPVVQEEVAEEPVVEETVAPEPAVEPEQEPVADEEPSPVVEDDVLAEIISEVTETAAEAEEEPAQAPEEFEVVEDEESLEPFELTDDEETDPMAAVEAFSKKEDGSLFDDEKQLPFENYFNVNKQDVHGDRTQTISLVPPEEDEDEDEQPKFKGFFKKK